MGSFDGTYFIENLETKRYAFSTGEKFSGERGDEGGWLKAPKCVSSDANYYNRAYWKILDQGDGKYFFENVETGRYLFSAGESIDPENRGKEGGWTNAPDCLGSDANYYNRAYWKILDQGDGKFFIENVETRRYLLSAGEPIDPENRGKEGGWTNAPGCLGSDANYYNRAYWKILKQ